MSQPPAPMGDLLSLPELIRVLEAGRLDEECTVKLARIRDYMREQMLQQRSGKATLTLVIDFKLDRGMVDVTSTIKAKTPEPARERTAMWVTRDGFTNQLPGQAQLPLTVADERAGAITNWGQD